MISLIRIAVTILILFLRVLFIFIIIFIVIFKRIFSVVVDNLLLFYCFFVRHSASEVINHHNIKTRNKINSYIFYILWLSLSIASITMSEIGRQLFDAAYKNDLDWLKKMLKNANELDLNWKNPDYVSIPRNAYTIHLHI